MPMVSVVVGVLGIDAVGLHFSSALADVVGLLLSTVHANRKRSGL